MKMTFLGTGTSHGVPVIACRCSVCTSSDHRNNRLRSSVLFEEKGAPPLLIDPSKDFRQQALRHSISTLEHVLVTHLHADHIHGIDELRVFNRITGKSIKLYLKEDFDREIRDLFPYLYGKLQQRGGGVTSIENRVVKPGDTFSIDSWVVTPVLLYHGSLPIFGYRVGDVAYLTDVSRIPEETIDMVKGVKILVIDALRYQPHATHFSLDQAIDAARKIGAKNTFFTHISHDLEHSTVTNSLPETMALSFDGLTVEI
jgi:phosphoribosyl 1,2-cyclic phosphate phosphodiesterase